MLAITFLFPLVLAAGAAAVAPVVIHLIMRTKPRRTVFPAMRFVKKTHQANISKLKLKHLILLAMRMAAIVLIAMLLARAELPSFRQVDDSSEPMAAVVVVDNSGSMNYRLQGRTLLARAQTLACQMVQSMSAGSRIAVITTASPQAATGFRSDRKFVAQQIAEAPAGFGHESLAKALSLARAMLEQDEMERKGIYVAGDMTAQSWREDAGTQRAKEIDFVVLRVGLEKNANMAMGEPRLSAPCVPVGSVVTIQTQVDGVHVGGEATVRLELDELSVDEQAVSVPVGGSADMRFSFQPKQEGTVHGRLVLVHSDPLEMDNVRYFTVRVAPPPTMWIVRDPTTVGRGSETSFLMANAVSPAGAQPGFGQWVHRSTITADRLNAQRLKEAQIVLLADVSSLSDSQWRLLEEFARRGGHVWVVVGSLTSPTAYNTPDAQRIMPAALKALEELAKPAGWQAAELRHPMLQPFADQANPPLSEVLCRRRFAIESVAGDAQTVLRYADEAPAIVSRRIGDGSVILWNFSPVRAFSNLAQLPQFVILTQRTVRLLAGAADVRTMCRFGESVTLSLPRQFERPVITVRAGGENVERPVAKDAGSRTVTLAADRLGPWTVQFAEGERRAVCGFSVNADGDESDLGPVEIDHLKAMFPPEHLTVASSVDELATRQRMVSQPLDLTIPLLLGLLVLLIAESFFANRFYRRAAQQEPA